MCSYNLEYKDYRTNVSDGLRSLFSTLDIADITLAVEGKLYKAHQVILSIFSPYFREIFCQNASKQTVIFMKGVKHRIMRDLLVFMYEGKVEIHEDDFNLFVETARELKIKGLTNEQDAAQVQTVSVPSLQNLEPETVADEEMPGMKRQLQSPAVSEAGEDTKRGRTSAQDDSTQTNSSPVDNMLTSCHSIIPPQHSLPPSLSMQPNMAPVTVQNTMYITPMPSQIVTMPPSIVSTMATPMAMPSTSWMPMPIMQPQSEIPSAVNIKQEKRDETPNKLEIGPTEVIYDNAKEDSIELFENDDNDGHDAEEHYMAGDVEIHDGRNVKNEANSSIVQIPPKIAEGEPVVVSLCECKKTQKVIAILWDGMRFNRRTTCKKWITWTCSLRALRKCMAKVILTHDNRIVVINPHSHATRLKRKDECNAIACTYYRLTHDEWMQRPENLKRRGGRPSYYSNNNNR